MKLITAFFSCIFLAACTSLDTTPPCMENPGQGKLFVFVGKKIDIKVIPHEGWDGKFLCRYLVEQKICGNYKKDTIEFTAFDHYGYPGFSKYENVMLFVKENNGHFLHEKYQYFDVYKTKNGRWASQSSRDERSDSTIKPEKLDFVSEVSFDISGLKKQDIKNYYPPPYFRIANGKAIVEYGNYAEELFILKKKGILTNRGLFGERKEMEFVETKLAYMIQSERIPLTKENKRSFLNYWFRLLDHIQHNQLQEIKTLAYDSVVCSVCEGFSSDHFYNDMEPIDSFASAANRYFPTIEEWKNNISKVNISAEKYIDTLPDVTRLNPPITTIIYTLYLEHKYKNDSIVGSEKIKRLEQHAFRFIKTGDSFKFYSVSK